MANVVRTKANGMHRKIKISQKGNGDKKVKLSVRRNSKIKVKKA